MGLFKNFGVGFSAYGKAMSMLFTKQLWWFLLFPVLLNIIFLIAGWLGIGSLTDYIENWLKGLMAFDGDSFIGASFLEPIAGYISGIAGFLVWGVLKFIFFFVFATIGGYIVIICLSPVFAILSEKTEEMLTGNKYPFNGDQIMRDVVRGILIAFRNMFIEFGYMILIFLLGIFIPIIGGVIGTILLFFIASYFYGFAFIDYTNERRRLTIKQSVKFIRANKGMAIANGMVFSFFMLIPFCGTTLAGFAAILSVVAATIATHKVVDLNKNPYAKNEEIIDNIELPEDENPKQIDESKED
ncbi:MAG: EI24 domain-containing protein [Flavobacteriales bacterium]|nr:EI24 domain-containing protein [Flavobacteriales bacterium]